MLRGAWPEPATLRTVVKIKMIPPAAPGPSELGDASSGSLARLRNYLLDVKAQKDAEASLLQLSGVAFGFIRLVWPGLAEPPSQLSVQPHAPLGISMRM